MTTYHEPSCVNYGWGTKKYKNVMRVGCSITPLLTRVSFKNVFMLTLYVGIKLCKAIIRIITAFLGKNVLQIYKFRK